ncbi:hypothetical protein SLEP1_g16097 [Rubroshorea leprosula]|uniref:Reverse transcriptase domain-containing protein n=1 Tax=Rubroshorea leprosula TaxID=152421 RepID=A0AAV5IYI7_9ROSI|nr:hypothetical protein SLEP1_g16097 [Rubroshorea leprosula]
MEECNQLKSELQSLARKGMLNEYVQRTYQPTFVKEQDLQSQGTRNANNRQGVGYQQAPPPLPPPARIIHMITGGLKAGRLSSKQRKLYVRKVKHQNMAQKRKFDDAKWKNQPITFTPVDFNGVILPHNDPLVTYVMINNCEVQRVLVDTGSAPNIMYYHCFESLGLDPALLQRYDGLIYGFNKQLVQVEGILTLNIAFGSDRTYVTPSTSKTAPQEVYDIQQIGRNLEVYVDDIVVKSLKVKDHIADLEETFNNLRQGIKVNPENIKAIKEMGPPKSMKEGQRLTGRVAALHRFVSKSIDKCLPFFKIMRSTAQKDESGK